MAAFSQTFVADEMPQREPRESGDFPLLPAGDYLIHSIGDEEKNASKGGTYHAFTFEIIDGQYAGRRIWYNLSLGSLNTKAIEIAQQNLSEMIRAAGLQQVDKGEEFLHLPMIGKVVVEPAKGDWPAKNQIKGFKPVGGAKPISAGAQAIRAAASPAPVSVPRGQPGAASPVNPRQHPQQVPAPVAGGMANAPWARGNRAA